jgi:hypothetical protein
VVGYLIAIRCPKIVSDIDKGRGCLIICKPRKTVLSKWIEQCDNPAAHETFRYFCHVFSPLRMNQLLNASRSFYFFYFFVDMTRPTLPAEKTLGKRGVTSFIGMLRLRQGLSATPEQAITPFPAVCDLKSECMSGFKSIKVRSYAHSLLS